MRTRSLRPVILAAAAALLIGMGVVTPVEAASIPAWLDDAISEWNDEHEALQIEFLDIKDSYVWYMVPRTAEIGRKAIRESVYEIIQNNGYQTTDQEELVTTGRPPSPVTPYQEKKCWTQSFVLNIEELSNTSAAGGRGRDRPGMRQRMLTSLVCEDVDLWYAGFRILQ